jgi:hypothetical protein
MSKALEIEATDIAFRIGSGVTTALMLGLGILLGYYSELHAAVATWGSDSSLVDVSSFIIGCLIVLGVSMLVGYACLGATKLVLAAIGNRES